MIISDGKNKFSIERDKLKEVEGGLVFVTNNDSWESELFFEVDKNHYVVNVIQRLYGGGDTLAEYKNLNTNSRLHILLEKEGYKRIFNFYNNLKNRKNYKKEAVIKAGAIVLSFYCYQYYCLEDQPLREHDLNDLLRDIEIDSVSCRKYRKEIISLAKKILKAEYKVSNKNISYIFKYENVEDNRWSEYI